MKNKKLLISSCIFVLLFAVTFGILFLTYSVDDLLLCLKMIKSTFYLIIGIAIIMFFTLEAIYFKIIFKSLDENISFRRCMYYSFVEFFFSGITPGSTGGQPVQLYYMNKDKIPDTIYVPNSTKDGLYNYDELVAKIGNYQKVELMNGDIYKK